MPKSLLNFESGIHHGDARGRNHPQAGHDLNDEETQLGSWRESSTSTEEIYDCSDCIVVEWDFDETWIYWDSDLVSLEYYKIILRIVTPFNY